MQLAEEGREIARHFMRQRAEVTQKFISRGFHKSALHGPEVQALRNKREAELSNLHGRWYSGLSVGEKSAFDDLCLVVAASVVRSHLPPSLPASLHGPLARLALEYAAVARRAGASRREREKFYSDSGLGPTAVASFSRTSALHEEEAKERLIGRWFGELTPEQIEAFDTTQPLRAVPTSGVPTRKPRPSSVKPDIPQMYRKPMRLLPKYQAIQTNAGKRWTVAGFCSWLRSEHCLSLHENDFSKWRVSYSRMKRRAAGADRER
jgi:hypothetical protein